VAGVDVVGPSEDGVDERVEPVLPRSDPTLGGIERHGPTHRTIAELFEGGSFGRVVLADVVVEGVVGVGAAGDEAFEPPRWATAPSWWWSPTTMTFDPWMSAVVSRASMVGSPTIMPASST
jgi:hypothetical protein